MFTTLWDKIKAWLSGAAQTIEVSFNHDEQALLTLVQPIFSAGETSLMQDLITFVTGVLTTSKGAQSLDDWETAVLNGLSALGGELETLGKSLGSNLLQAIIGLLLTKLAMV